MNEFIVEAYAATIHNEWYEDGYDVLIGVVPNDLPQQAYDGDWWADEKIYYYLNKDEFLALKVGDVLNDGEDFTVVKIDKVNPTIFKLNYEKEYV